jgi:hypothetical protein
MQGRDMIISKCFSLSLEEDHRLALRAEDEAFEHRLNDPLSSSESR